MAPRLAFFIPFEVLVKVNDPRYLFYRKVPRKGFFSFLLVEIENLYGYHMGKVDFKSPSLNPS
jgi:hypothetical protein